MVGGRQVGSADAPPDAVAKRVAGRLVTLR